MSSTSPPGDTPIPAPSSSSVLAGDSSDTMPVLPPLSLSFHSSGGLGPGDVQGSSSPPPNADDHASNIGLDAEPGLVKSTMSFSDASISPPVTNPHPTHSSSSPSPTILDLRSIPIPVPVTPATIHGTNSQVIPTRTFIMAPSKSITSDLGAEQENNVDSSRIDIDSLPPEVTKADLFIAPDGSFVQTSSALAARELKKCYDKILRVGHRDQVVRSPYAITAVEDESGVKVFRISRRDDDSAPLPSDHSISQPQAQNQSITTAATTSSRRKARLSVQDFLPSGMFKPSNNAAAVGSTNLNQPQNGSNISSSPVTNSSPSSPPPVTRRKLRKTRSNSDLHSRVTLSPSNSTDTHSQAPSQHHASRYTYGYDTYSVYPAFEIRDELTAGADAFSQVLGWASELATDTSAIASSSRRKGKSMSGAVKGLPILIGNADDNRIPVDPHDEVDPTSISAPATQSTASSSRSRSSSAAGLASVQNTATNFSRRPSVSTSAALSNVGVANNGVINNLNNSFHNYIIGESWRIASPFGESVKYTTPLRVSNGNSGLDSDPITVVENSLPLMEDSLSQPPQFRELREMQSFESGLTARIGDISIGNGQERRTASSEPDTALGAASSEPDTPKFAKEEMKNPVHVSLGDCSFPSDSNSWLHFSTRVFDVIQTYKGLPLPSALSSAPPTGATIKMTATESPNPKDDPRFVIWGELYGDSGDASAANRDDASMSVSISGGSQTESNTQSSHTHSTSSAAPLPPRKRSNARQPDSLPSTNPEAAPRTVIIAATVERWIAQLTSELDYDELLNFLLTYRTYITPVDLCHLLICRFHWALEKPTSKQDEMVRRIIRVRTFIAIRYWLLTFFREDFLPNSALCALFTAWLNSLFRDLSTRGDGGGDALSIVRKLKKVVRECKAAHARRGTDAVASSSDLNTDDSDVDLDFSSVHYVRGPSHSSESGVETISSSTGIDVGISFDGAAKFGVYPTLSAKTGPATFTALTTAHVPFTSPDTLLLSQPLSKTILDHVKSPKPGIDAPLAQAAGIGTLPLPSRSGAPYHSSAISRAFVNTIGRLGRWKRVLNVRSSAAVGGSSYAANMAIGYIPQIEVRNLSPESLSNPFPAESSFGSASGITRDPRVGTGKEVGNPAEELLHVKGGVEEYLKMLKLGPANSEAERNASSTIALSKEGILAPEQSDAEGLGGVFMSINNDSTDDSREDGDDHPYPPRPPGLDIPSFSVISTTGSFSSSARSVMDSNPVPPALDDQLGMDKQITVENMANPVPTSAFSCSGSEQGESHEDGREVAGSTYEAPVQGASDIHLKEGWTPDAVSLDDYDLSTSESDLSSVDGQNRAGEDVGVGVGIRKGKTARRLPLRREFQFVRGSGGSVSSLGIRSRSSFVLSVRSRSGSRERESERIDSVTSAATRKRNRNDGSPTSSSRSSHSSSLSSQRTTSQAGTSHVEGYTSQFQQWQIELISDDEEEAGDAEAALRRLEGQIDVERQREKDMKVGRWLKTARAKAPDGIDFSAEGSRRHVGERKYSVSAESVGSMESGTSLSVESVGYKDEEGDFSVNLNPTMIVASTSTNTEHGRGSNAQERDRSGSVSSMASISSSSGYVKSGASVPTSADAAYMRTSTTTSHAARHPTVLSSKRADVNSNLTFKPSSVSNATAAALGVTGNSSASIPMPGHAPPAPLSSPGSTVPYAYRSFILLHRSELLARQFMIIEADFFKRIKFEEIISHQWGQAIEDVNVRDWVSFVKERARLKNAGATFGGGGASGGGGSDSNGETHPHSTSIIHTATHPKLSSILALRARFDLVVNFVASEVVLTHPVERVILIEKIIRIAWKMYLHNNFNTLVAIVSGLQTRWVNKAMGKKWNKVGMWEQRIFEDLKRFASREGEFKYIRNATAALIDQRPLGSGVEGGTISSPSVTGNSFDRDKDKEHSSSQGHSPQHQQPFCLPFLGAYLAQLYAYEKLPDFIDPTAPTEPVLIDISTGTLSPPSHSEVFFNLQPLPEDIALEPLINVHKQRMIAGVIKAFVGAQHLAACVPFGVDVKSYQRCFRIRSLETEVLQSLLGREAGAG